MAKSKVRTAIIGIGNCASALVQGVQYYQNADENEKIPGLMNPVLGGYHINDIEFSAAIDISATKVGKDLSEAIWEEPNNTYKFSDVPFLDVPVSRGMTHDGLGTYLQDFIKKAPGPTDDIVKTLKDSGTDVVINFLPVGSEMATKWYVEQVLEAGCAFVNGIPVFIATSEYWSKRFSDKGLPVIGDDIKTALKEAGYSSEIELILAPAWTTDWITPRGRKALEDYGIAAPLDAESDKDVLLHGKKIVKCPQCGSTSTRLISQFGSTACKAQFQCDDCQEPFDYFKCLK